MKRKPRLPWWQMPALITAGVTGLGALGGIVITTAKVLTVPERLEAAEKEIDDLKSWAKEIQGYTRAMQQQQARPLRRYDDWSEQWVCCDPQQSSCSEERSWHPCE